MGIPDADVDRLSRHGTVVGSALSGIETPEAASALAAANAELYDLFSELIPLKRAHPGDDVISYLVAAEPDGITPYELHTTARLLLIAGFETTVNLIGNGVAALLDHRDQWDLLRSDPDAWPPTRSKRSCGSTRRCRTRAGTPMRMSSSTA